MANDKEGLHFGIGCFYFTVRPGIDLSWEDAVMQGLTSLPGVSDVEIDLGTLLDHEAQAGPGFYPSRGMLRFRLEVSLHEQRNLHGLLRHVQNIAERITVMIYFRYYKPVAFVLPLGAESTMDLVAGVVMVREYLLKQFSALELPVKLHTVGPSPFHADLCAKPAAIDSRFNLVRAPSRGYDDFTFLYSTKLFSSSAEAAITLFDDISDELSLYYSMVSRNGNRYDDEGEIRSLVQHLISIFQAKGFKALVRRVFTSSAKIRQVALKIVNAEYVAQDDSRAFREEMNELYATDITPYFNDFLESEIASCDTTEMLAAKETITLLDQARQRQIELSSLFLSAVAGGLAGALVSLLVH